MSYSRETLAVLTAIWEAAGYPWSVRLKALLPQWMPWIHRRFALRPEIMRQLLAISARQIDRRLADQKKQRRRSIYGRTKPGYLLKHHIPVKTEAQTALGNQTTISPFPQLQHKATVTFQMTRR